MSWHSKPLDKKNRCYNIFRLRSISLTELFPLTTSVPFSYFWSVTPFFSILVYLCCHLHRRRQSHPASLSLPRIHKILKEECPNMFKSRVEIYFSWAAFASYQVLKLLSPSKTGAKKSPLAQPCIRCIRFTFILLFWNHILICRSVRPRWWAISILLRRVR